MVRRGNWRNEKKVLCLLEKKKKKGSKGFHFSFIPQEKEMKKGESSCITAQYVNAYN